MKTKPMPRPSLLKYRIVNLQLRIARLNRERDATEIQRLERQIGNYNRKIAAIETDELLNEAQKYGIEIPKDKKHWWWDDLDYEGEDFRNYLTDAGKAGVRKLLRDDWRASVLWWVQVVVSVLTVLTGLLGALIGALALLKR